MTRARLTMVCVAAFALGIAACVIGPKQDDPAPGGAVSASDSGTSGFDARQEDPTVDAITNADTSWPTSDTSVATDTGSTDSKSSDAGDAEAGSESGSDAVSESSADAPEAD